MITSIDGQKVKNYSDLYNVLERKPIGATLRISIERDGRPMSLHIRTIDTAKMR